MPIAHALFHYSGHTALCQTSKKWRFIAVQTKDPIDYCPAAIAMHKRADWVDIHVLNGVLSSRQLVFIMHPARFQITNGLVML